MTEHKRRMVSSSEISKYCGLMYQRDMVSSTGGNVSVREGNTVYISPTGSVLADLTRDDMVAVSLAGEAQSQGAGPSKELPFHLGIYRARPDVQAVIHGHSPYAVIASTLIETDPLDSFPAYTAGYISRVTRLPLLPYFDSGSKELSEAVSETFAAGAKALLLQNHGFVTVGPDLKQAFTTADELMDAVKTLVFSHCQAKPLEPDDRERLRAKTALVATAGSRA